MTIKPPRVSIPAAHGDAFVDAWRQVHYAAQVVAEFGKLYAKPLPDDSHTTLSVHRWQFGDMIGVPLRGASARDRDDVFAMLVPGSFVSISAGSESKPIMLDGITLEEATANLREVARSLLGEPLQESVPAPDLPDHPLASGAAFTWTEDGHSPELGAIDDLYSAADYILQAYQSTIPNTSSVSVWPHHFDIAALTAVATNDDGSLARTIGVGLTPPDDVDPSGYWYVSPWSANAVNAAEWRDLPHGHWHDRGSLSMAVLPVSEVSALDESARVDAVMAFIERAHEMSAAALS